MMSDIVGLSKLWKIPTDKFLQQVKSDWYTGHQVRRSGAEVQHVLNQWFQSTKVNSLKGWETLSCIDLTMGCAHYIESFILGQHGLDAFQILPDEYAYYSFLGKWGTEPGSLQPNKPLIVTLPHYKWGGIRPGWDDILQECLDKNIEVHLDMAWLTLSKDIDIDFAHPAIRSVGMSISKYDLQWNRVGLRYTKQRKMDSITIFNHFYPSKANENLYSCAAYCAERIPRDYAWDTYNTRYQEICDSYGLERTSLIHGAKKNDTVYCITDLLSPHTK